MSDWPPRQAIGKDDRIRGLRLWRKLGEKILINGGEIVIQLVATKKGSAQIAFSSDPDKFSIHREEALFKEPKP